MIPFIFLGVAFLASVIGSICGIGGGVIIKPVLDATGLYPVSTISFMSGCIVLAMAAYSVLKAQMAGDSQINAGISTFLGLGAAAGGLLGKQLFDMTKALFSNSERIGAVQATVLLIITFGTAIYTANKYRIPTRQICNHFYCILIGLCLGVMSSFLGIGGGPINLVVLYYFFSMETKTAAQNSLYIILLSQLASLIFTVVTGKVPNFPVFLFAAMVSCGILGGMMGRKINRQISSSTVSKLFLGLLCMIMIVCCYNIGRYCH